METRVALIGIVVTDFNSVNGDFPGTFHFNHGNFFYQNSCGASFCSLGNGNTNNAAESGFNRFGIVFDLVYYVSYDIPYQ